MYLLTRYSEETGALKEVHKLPGACHKHFKTKHQAEAFIEDWKEACADVVRRAVKQALDQGNRPRDMKLDITSLWRDGEDKSMLQSITEQLGSELKL
jgi:hypothetical protein